MAGQRIDDHSFWAGGRGKDSVLPDGPYKTKAAGSAEGAGELGKYEDTSEAIKASQQVNKQKVKSHPQKAGYRS